MTGTLKLGVALAIALGVAFVGINAQTPPEIGNRVTIAGPARVTIRPIVGAKLFISYRMQGD